MKLLAFEVRGPSGRSTHIGALVEGTADRGSVLDLTAAVRTLLGHQGLGREGADRLTTALAPSSLLGFVQGGARSRATAEEAVAAAFDNGWEVDPRGASLWYRTEQVAPLPAITDPPLLRDFMAFEEHLVNVFPRLGRAVPEEWYRRPVYYKGNPSAIGAHEQAVAVPSYADRLDLEFEFAAVIGREGVDIPEEEAMDHVYGYTVYNDFSARAVQAAEMTVGLGPAKGKDFLGAHVLGPVLVTADELGDPYALAMSASVNGVLWTERTTADMHWRFEQMIAYASRDELVRVGEVFGSGTVGGGSGAEQDRWLDAGDLVELTVGKIGTLRNRVVASRAASDEAGRQP